MEASEHLTLTSAFADLPSACRSVMWSHLAEQLCRVPAAGRKQGGTWLGHVVCGLGFYVSGSLQVPSCFNPLPLAYSHPYSHPNAQESGSSGLDLSINEYVFKYLL